MSAQEYYQGGGQQQGPPPPQQQQQYSMQQSNPYAEQYKAPDGPPPQQHENWDYKNEKFAPMKPKFNDLFFAFLFILQFGAFTAISVIALRSLSETSGSVDAGLGGKGGNSLTLDLHTAYLLCFIAAAALLLAIGLLGLVRAFTKIILELTLILSVIVSVGYAVYLYIRQYWSGAIIATIFAVISLLAYPFMRRRIPFSRAVLQLVLRIAGEYKSTYVIALIGTVVQAAYSIWWSFTAVAAYQRFSTNGAGCAAGARWGCSEGSLIGIIVFLAFSFYWTTQFIANLFLTTEAGIFGTWYFTGGKHAPEGAPSKVAWGAFKRASTYSFGSIAFGSLIVALLDMLKAVLDVIRNQARSEGDMIGYIAACIASCCVGCITWMVEFFNRYAYIEIALYGKPYITAAKDTWRLFKDRGIDALVNDLLIGNIWTFGSYAVGALCGLFAYLYLKLSDVQYIERTDLTAIVLLYAFFVGFQITYSLGYGCLSSGASTIFVGLAEDPAALAQRDPALFEIIRQTYPHVVQGV